MNTAEDLFIALFEQAQLAQKFKFRFDLFWNKEVSYRASARMSYLIRHTVLLSCFEGLLLLFCSREMWEHGEIGRAHV